MDLSMKRISVLYLLCFAVLSFPVEAGSSKESVAYRLAVLHARNMDPLKALTSGGVEPSPATLREFEWIMATLKDHCKNPEPVLGNIIVETWRGRQRNGSKQSLLDVARKLNWVVKNSGFYGKAKVNFEVVSSYVLKAN